MKRFSAGLILGLIAGLFLATATFALANNPIRIFLNGQELQNTEAMIVNERTYVPLRMVSEALGLNVDWDEGQRAVLLNYQATAQSAPQSPPNPNEINTKEELDMEVIETTFNNISAIIVNGQTYFNAGQYAEILRNGELNPKNKIIYDQDSKVSTIHIDGGLIEIPFTDENIQIYKGQTYFNTRFYSE